MAAEAAASSLAAFQVSANSDSRLNWLLMTMTLVWSVTFAWPAGTVVFQQFPRRAASFEAKGLDGFERTFRFRLCTQLARLALLLPHTFRLSHQTQSYNVNRSNLVFENDFSRQEWWPKVLEH